MSLFQKKNTHTRDFERNIFLSKPVSKFPCQPSLPTRGSLSFLRIPTLALTQTTRAFTL